MRLIVIGGVAGGASVAARVRRLDQEAEIIIFERGRHVSYSNCALPYHLSGAVPNSDSLVLMTPEEFKNTHNIEVRVESEIISINREKKTVTVKDIARGEIYDEDYDKLVISTGAEAIVPENIEGVHGKNVFTVRDVTDIKALKEFTERDNVKKVTVIGGGFIGTEVAENLRLGGLEVSIVEGSTQILAPFDDDMIQILHKEMAENGIKLYLSTTAEAITETGIKVVHNGNKSEIETDAVVLAIGTKPETGLAVKAGLDIGETGGILVDHNYLTSDKDIYAVGDVIESFNRLTGKKARLPLAGPAQRQARAAADHIFGIHHNNRGFIGSSCVRVFRQNAASTGLNEKACKKAGIHYDYVFILPNDKVSLMPESSYMAFKLIFEIPTGRILGAQAIGYGAADKRVDIIAAMITMGADLEDLKELELCYSPVYGTPKDVVNIAAFAALNILYGKSRQVHMDEVRDLVENGAYIIDVRGRSDFNRAHIINSVNIPLSELRERMDEVPKDRPVYVCCRTSHRSYYALAYLKGYGFDNICNISGSILGLSLYEYYRDHTEERKPILTGYVLK